ncbi:MAG: sigma-70 family RNA polymerase sigma factor [Oscillospiraceae bacterium]|nr:sigma-70 family RNA polymerase sigma factor [Oscillospiraceae bacterium]
MLKAYSLPYPQETSETDCKLINQGDLYLIKEVKSGNGDAFRVLSERYNNIISYNISKIYSYSVNSSSKFAFAALNSDKEDLFQECRIILYKAAKYYDFMKDVKFSTYANICIKNYLVSLCRKYGKTEKYSGYAFISFDEIRENESVKYDRYFDFSDFSSFLSFINVNILTALEKKVFMMYVENKSYKYMARMLNKSVKSIDNAICRVKSKLKPYAEYFVSEY